MSFLKKKIINVKLQFAKTFTKASKKRSKTWEQLFILNFKTHPIELLWGYLKRVGHSIYPPNQKALETFEKNEWANVAKEVNSNL